MSTDVFARFAKLSTPLFSDAALRVGHPLRLAPSGLQPVHERARMMAGPVAAARHRGSVDVFLEVISKARQGDVLVIDNDGRKDEGCIGDLTALEAWTAGVAGSSYFVTVIIAQISVSGSGRSMVRRTVD